MDRYRQDPRNRRQNLYFPPPGPAEAATPALPQSPVQPPLTNTERLRAYKANSYSMSPFTPPIRDSEVSVGSCALLVYFSLDIQTFKQSITQEDWKQVLAECNRLLLGSWRHGPIPEYFTRGFDFTNAIALVDDEGQPLHTAAQYLCTGVGKLEGAAVEGANRITGELKNTLSTALGIAGVLRITSSSGEKFYFAIGKTENLFLFFDPKAGCISSGSKDVSTTFQKLNDIFQHYIRPTYNLTGAVSFHAFFFSPKQKPLKIVALDEHQQLIPNFGPRDDQH